MTIYLLTGPQTNRIGLFYISVVTAADDLNWTAIDTTARLKTVCAAFDWFFDALTSVVWIPSWWDWNTPTENEKNMRGALSDLSDVPTTPLIIKFATHLTFVPESLHRLFNAIADRQSKRTPDRSQTRTPTEHCSNTDPEIVPQDKTRSDQTRQAGDGEARPVLAAPRTPDRSSTGTPAPDSADSLRTADRSSTRTAALVPQSSHRTHAMCGLICLPAALFEDFVKRARHRPDPEAYVTAFVQEWCARYESGDRKTDEIGTDTFDFWRARWKETHPQKPVETAMERAEAILARRRGQV